MVTPKKHLGQHFLTDVNIAHRISELLIDDCKNVIEIGPGKGILTKNILDKPSFNLKAIEIDGESIEYLNQLYPQYSNRFIFDDFLQLNLDSIFEAGEHFQIIGNYPYNISSQILFKALDYREKVDCISGMFQKEVAQRIITPPGSKVYGILSVLMQTWYDCEYCFTVNEGSFFPPPKVKSGVIRLKRNNVHGIGVDEKLFINVVKTAFNQRRKTLRNSLKCFNVPEMEILSRRPETLSSTEFIELTTVIAGQ